MAEGLHDLLVARAMTKKEVQAIAGKQDSSKVPSKGGKNQKIKRPTRQDISPPQQQRE
jgi:hypothetical protein